MRVLTTAQRERSIQRADECPMEVRRPVMLHDWRELTFLHWRYDPELVGRLLPPGLTLDTFDGHAWIGVVPFVLSVWTAAGRVGARFPEINLRTYVRGPDGVPGVWFLTLDAARTDAVVTAHLTHRLPYVRARMQVDVGTATVAYRSRRRWPHAPAHLRAEVSIGEAIPAADVSDLERFLIARFCLYSVKASRLQRAWADHAPWSLRRAEVAHLDQTVVQAVGLPAPAGAPLVHYSDGVTVRVGPLAPVDRESAA